MHELTEAGQQDRQQSWPRWRWAAWIAGLTLAVLVVQGYHPFSEDGGLYAVGAEWLLDRRLFPLGTQFVTDHVRWSVFAWVMAGLARGLHLPLEWVLLLTYLATAALMLVAARAVLRRCGCTQTEQLGGMALLAAWWPMPVAGTSLMLMDPYATARSFSTPLALLAVAWALDEWGGAWNFGGLRSMLLCVGALVVAMAFHPLMGTYAAGLVILLRMGRLRRREAAWLVFGLVAVAAAGVLQGLAKPESGALAEAAYSRYYWFLSQWQMYELVGLVGPLVVLGALVAWPRAGWNDNTKRLVKALAVLCAIGVACALLLAQERYRVHFVARLQPLRVYLPVYAVLAMLLGAAAVRAGRSGRLPRATAVLLILASAAGMFYAQRTIYPASSHLELPGRMPHDRNGYVRAFVWIRDNTPRDALFAMDAHYIALPGEDAQVFRAIAERNALADFSKDGGEAAAMRPQLAARWQREMRAQTGLDQMTDAQRDARLAPFGATWIVLPEAVATAYACPYANEAVKVCRLS